MNIRISHVNYIVKWSNVLREQEASEEKFQAMEGLSKAILLNPAPVEPAFAYLCLLILRWPLQPNTREFKFFQGFLVSTRHYFNKKKKELIHMSRGALNLYRSNVINGQE